MTEAEWFQRLRRTGQVSQRQLRLLAVACCRRAWHLFTDDARAALEASERFADDCGVFGNLRELAGGLELPPARFRLTPGWETRAEHIAGVACRRSLSISDLEWLMGELAIAIKMNPHSWESWFGWHKAARAHARYLECVIGPEGRGRPGALPANENCLAIARACYAEAAFDRLPILGDALEDAGCTDRAILDHCHQPGEHVRGCWVVDLLLGKQ